MKRCTVEHLTFTK